MSKIPFFIVADRGVVKTFRVEETPGHGASPRLLDAHQVADGRGRLQDKVTDQAGAFPNAGSAGQGNSVAEKMTLRAEYEMRSFRDVASHMIALLREHKPERWAFAAPSEINGAILDGLPPDLMERLKTNLPRDLVNVPVSQLMGHFAQA